MTDEEEEAAERPSLRVSLGRFALAVLAVAVTGVVAGVAYGRSSPERAAASLIDALVVEEEPRGDDRTRASTEDPAPTSGDHLGEPACGVSDAPVDVDTQLASLAAGRVVVQYDPAEVAGDARARLLDWARDGRARQVLVAPNPRLQPAVVATAWTRRLALDEVERTFLSAFVTAYAGGGPRPEPCADAG